MYIESLEIENIKGFESLALDFRRPNGKPLSGMNVFVGGNASGKTTLLKCIAMVLMGEDDANFSIISTKGWLSNGQNRGYITLNIYWPPFEKQYPLPFGRYQAQLDFDAKNKQTIITDPFPKNSDGDGTVATLEAEGTRENWDPWWWDWSLSAYGVVRRLSRGTNRASRFAYRGGKVASCSTLFDEGADLHEGHAWLLDMHAFKQEQELALSGKKGVGWQEKEEPSLFDNTWTLLNDGLLPEGFSLQRVSHADKDIYVKTPSRAEISMNDLSDGCRSVYSLILDIILNMASAYRATNLFGTDSKGRIIVTAPGVVLIDELESHLHPTWQQKICDWLKTRFPNVQFFVTTHSPLIAQAADEGGLFVLPMAHEAAQGQQVHRLSPEEQDQVRLGGAEEVLTSEAFGLNSTWSLKTQSMIQEWNRIQQKIGAGLPLTEEEQAGFEELRRQVLIAYSV